MSDDIDVSDNTGQHRYEASRGADQLGFAAYELDDRTITFTHTEVAPAAEGQGIGSILVRAALDDARARGLTVRARCPFVKAFVARHREYQDLL
ncbi:MAG TPA: GNAT family N-acetyltransferase [Dermatophilaceae bacterium]|nr:GNAT family N-acetyltransferase [Dermatophilaceae bacterium]